MKEALTKYREKSQKNEKNDSINRTQPSYSSTIDISNINVTKQKFNKNNTIKFDKNLLNFAESRTKVKEFYKIQPKIIDSFFLDDEDNIEGFFENENKNEDEVYNIDNNNIICNNIIAEKYNKNIKMQKNKNKNKKFNLSITDTNDNEDTIINDNDYEDTDSFNSKLDNNEKNKDLNLIYNNDNFIKENKIYNKGINEKENNLINNNISLNINITDINLDYLLLVEKLFNELMKDIEINEMEIYQNKLIIIKDFLYIFNDQNILYLYDIVDNKFITYNMNLILKEYIVEQFVFFYIIILIGLIKKEKNIFHSGLHNLSFYFHQSFIVFIYIIITNININCKNNSENIEIMNNLKKCMKILDENKTWLDKNNYKNYLQTNNNLSKQILINILNQIKYFFHLNPYSINDNQNEFIDECINLFLSYLKSFQNYKIINFIKEINNSSSIIQLLDMINLNKVLSEFGSQNNNNLENNNEVFNIENNTNVEEVPKEPFLKPLNPKYKYTLVLDLDETLVHYISDNDSAYIQIRPGAEEFLKELSEYYEIIIFTAALQNYADLVIDGIDPNGVISDRLYRQHTINIGNINIKDLNKLGRDIKHIIIIDNFKDNYSLQPKNGLNIIDFEGNEYDDELEYLKEDLLKLVKLNPDDVRLYLEDIQKNMDKRAIYSQKINDENKNEVIDDDIDNDKNNLISDIINININKEDKIKSDYKVKIYKKGYSFTEESENAEVDKV
jgi:Dullard-like phosphatase family protein